MMKTYTLKPLNQNNQTLPENFGDDLNPSQKEAAFFDQGPLLLIAGAGSGKTKTLVYRVARLVHEGVKPETILLLTFTRKAAQEMLSRAEKILDNRCQNISGGTFHSFANIILRQYSEHIGYESNFTILDRSDAEDIIQFIRKEKGLAKSDKRFPKKGTIASIIGKAINTGKPLEHIIGNEYPQFMEFTREIEAIAIDYVTQKQTMKVMDYDDLLVNLLHLLKTSPEVREKLQQFYSYILVDEYQDTNIIQSEIIRHLANANNNVMVVGDDSQSIYSFRGAHYKNIMSFPDKFPGATVIKLEQNYRSTQPILNLTNAVIEHAKDKYDKTLFTQNEGEQKPVYIETNSENAQSRFICQKILELSEAGTSLNDIAILMRSGWHSNDLEVELKSHNIPFVKHGGFKFIEASHIKDILAYLKLIFNPADAISWNRVLVLIEGLGSAGAQKIIQDITSQLQNKTIDLSKHSKKKFYTELTALIHLVFNPNNTLSTPQQLMEKVISHYTPLFKLTYDNFNKRQTDIDSIETISAKYTDLETLLSELTLEPPNESQSDSLPEDFEDEIVTLSTIHSAKGLEWDSVFLLSAVDGYLPSFQSLGDLAQIEEERRLMYVALTRAKSNLFIIKPNLTLSNGNYYKHTGMQFSKPSRFLSEYQVLQNYTETWALQETSPQIKKPKPVHKSNLPKAPWDDDFPQASKQKYYF